MSPPNPPASKNIRSRLGRGLSSLMSASNLPAEVELADRGQTVADTPSVKADGAQSVPGLQTSEINKDSPIVPRGTMVLEIPVGIIDPNPHQPRRRFDELNLSELAASLKRTGLIQPIVVRQVGTRYQLIAGERRLRAAKLAELSVIPAIVREADGIAQAQMALIENIHRADLNPIERAAAYRALIDQLGLTQAELAGRLGEDRSQIAHFLRLLELSATVQEMVQDGRLTMGHAKLLAGITNSDEQDRLAGLAVSQALSVRNLERVIQTGQEDATVGTKTVTTVQVSAHIQELEKDLARQLGLRIQIRPGARKGSGRMVVHYSSLDQFDEFMTRLGVKVGE